MSPCSCLYMCTAVYLGARPSVCHGVVCALNASTLHNKLKHAPH
jgi:hypothetical protein